MTNLELILSLILFSILLIIIFDFRPIIKKMIDVQISNILILLILLLPLFILNYYFVGFEFVAMLGLIVFTMWAFLFGFNVNRKYIYLLALVFLGATPILILLDIQSIAEYFAILSYLLLVLGVVRDLFYEKIFKE